MVIAKTVDIGFVLLLSNEDAAKRLGPPLWQVFSAVEGLFANAANGGWLDVPVGRAHTRARIRPVFSRHYLGPPGLALDPAPASAAVSFERLEPLWEEADRAAPGRPRQYAHEALGDGVQGLIESTATLIVVTDRQIVPPPGFRYIIWDVFRAGAVMSVAPLEPEFFGVPETEVVCPDPRISALEWRARAACFSIVGSLLGLTRCRNESCYLYANVDSVSRLDSMDGFGPEHEVDALVGAR